MLSGYEIAAGHRRARAAHMAGLTHVPCMVREMSDAELLDELCKVRDASAIDKLRARPADDLELSVRSANALAAMKLETIGAVEQLMAMADDVILERGKRHYFTKKSIKEVRLLLISIGLGSRRNAAPSGTST
jgi:ParB-like chromosome segregation protein Spo0J